jgi:predicted DCC family thiol-disulfide oxidoreductase YuxK
MPVTLVGEITQRVGPPEMTLTLIYDGECPFCQAFALRSELAAGVPDLSIVDGRQAPELRRQLLDQGLSLRNGAMLMDGDQVWHGSAAIAELSSRMQPSDALLQVLHRMFRHRGRAAFFYPALLLARRIALALKGLSPDPDS